MSFRKVIAFGSSFMTALLSGALVATSTLYLPFDRSTLPREAPPASPFTSQPLRQESAPIVINGKSGKTGGKTQKSIAGSSTIGKDLLKGMDIGQSITKTVAAGLPMTPAETPSAHTNQVLEGTNLPSGHSGSSIDPASASAPSAPSGHSEPTAPAAPTQPAVSEPTPGTSNAINISPQLPDVTVNPILPASPLTETLPDVTIAPQLPDITVEAQLPKLPILGDLLNGLTIAPKLPNISITPLDGLTIAPKLPQIKIGL